MNMKCRFMRKSPILLNLKYKTLLKRTYDFHLNYQSFVTVKKISQNDHIVTSKVVKKEILLRLNIFVDSQKY